MTAPGRLGGGVFVSRLLRLRMLGRDGGESGRFVFDRNVCFWRLMAGMDGGGGVKEGIRAVKWVREV